MIKQTIIMHLEGDADSDIEIAFEEVIRKVKDGYICGHDNNETGNYSFRVETNEYENRKVGS